MQAGRAIIAGVVALALWLTLSGSAASSSAASSGSRVWEQTGFGEFATRLFAPKSGALFAVRSASADGRQFRRESGDVHRSDDGGTTWRKVRDPAPEERPDYIVRMTIDPVMHPVAYAVFDESLYKSDDDGLTWRVIDAVRDGFRIEDNHVAVSAADHRIVYAIAFGNITPDSPAGWWIRQSDDGGETWHDGDASASRRGRRELVSELYPSATDPDRVLRAIGSGGDGVVGHRLELSTDRGLTWTTVISESGPDASFLHYFATGPEGTIYVAGYRGPELRGSVLWTGPDGGQTWTRRIADGVARDVYETPWLHPGGVAADPTRPGHAYAAFNAFTMPRTISLATRTGVVLKQTTDGGATWVDVETDDPGEVFDIVVGVDGRALFAATKTGVRRLPIE